MRCTLGPMPPQLLVSRYREALDTHYPTYLGIHSTNKQTRIEATVARQKRTVALLPKAIITVVGRQGPDKNLFRDMFCHLDNICRRHAFDDPLLAADGQRRRRVK